MRRAVILLCVLAMCSLYASANTIWGWTTPGQSTTFVPYATTPVNFGPVQTSPSSYTDNNVTFTGSFDIDAGDLANVYRSPFGDNTTTFISVPKGGLLSSGTYVISFAANQTYNYFGLYWGSVDLYNTIRFYDKNHNLIGTIDGAQAFAIAHFNVGYGDPAANAFFNFVTSTPFATIEVESTNFAMETGHDVFGRTPEPGSMALFGSGIVTLAAILRRRMKL